MVPKWNRKKQKITYSISWIGFPTLWKKKKMCIWVPKLDLICLKYIRFVNNNIPFSIIKTIDNHFIIFLLEYMLSSLILPTHLKYIRRRNSFNASKNPLPPRHHLFNYLKYVFVLYISMSQFHVSLLILEMTCLILYRFEVKKTSKIL